MNRSLSLSGFVLAGALFLPLTSLAKDKACLLEGAFEVMGETTEIKDCWQNNGIPQKHFVQTCEQFSQFAASMGAPPAEITYLPSCPDDAQASCQKPFGKPLAAYYYKRGEELLSDSETSCEAMGGQWQEG